MSANVNLHQPCIGNIESVMTSLPSYIIEVDRKMNPDEYCGSTTVSKVIIVAAVVTICACAYYASEKVYTAVNSVSSSIWNCFKSSTEYLMQIPNAARHMPMRSPRTLN